jgi:hypothetical protein
MSTPKILIVGTVPYNKRSTSRAFESYFHGYEKSCLAQIFSNTKKPARGHCQTLFQITDQRMVLRRMKRKLDTGIVYQDQELEPEWEDNSLEVGSAAFEKMYRVGSKKSPLIYLLRGLVWKKKYWCTEKLNRWMDEFRPDCVFLAFSDDFFIPQIALYAARRYNIPIVSCIGDDYYFNDRFSLSPLYHLYRRRYKKLVDRVFAHGGSAIYISDKIRDQYNSYFGLKGQTVYLTSDLQRREFAPLPATPTVAYFGNIGLGRYRSLYEIGVALGEICPGCCLDIFSNQAEEEAMRLFDACPNIRFRGSISYKEVQEQIAERDVFIIVEGFRQEDINATRYSLSTKAADGLASGAHILVYGPEEAGVVSYMAGTDSAVVCTARENLADSIRRLLADPGAQKQRYDHAVRVSAQNHTLESSTAIFRGVVADVVKNHGKERL